MTTQQRDTAAGSRATTTAPDSVRADAHRLGPGWMAVAAAMIFVLSIHPIRRWRRARRARSG